MNRIIQCDSGTSRRLTMAHASNKNFSIEFIHPSSIEQAHRVGSKGGTINLFTLPTKNIDILKERLGKTAFFRQLCRGSLREFSKRGRSDGKQYFPLRTVLTTKIIHFKMLH
ncbi:hypothetical protein CLU94_1604 [Janthinobacterium sp. 13]|nr:hypothetical protein CLU94_1604 [Janthinobacterium sp. 13]